MIPVELFIALIVFFAGLCAGSFFNVLIWRLPRNESIVFPGSHCPSCNRAIKPWENVPVLSYLVLRGKCAGCKQPISAVYPIIELVTGGTALILLHTVGSSFSSNAWHDIHVVLQCIVLLLMIPITVIDIRHYIIPDGITLSFLVIAIAASFMPGDTQPLQMLLGILAGGGTLYGIGWLGTVIFRKGEAMGGGDIKLLAMVGALWGPKYALLTIFFGSIAGSLGALVMVINRKLKKDHLIPFGPYLAVGLWITVLTGDRIISAYMDFVARMMYQH